MLFGIPFEFICYLGSYILFETSLLRFFTFLECLFYYFGYHSSFFGLFKCHVIMPKKYMFKQYNVYTFHICAKIINTNPLKRALVITCHTLVVCALTSRTGVWNVVAHTLKLSNNRRRVHGMCKLPVFVWATYANNNVCSVYVECISNWPDSFSQCSSVLFVDFGTICLRYVFSIPTPHLPTCEYIVHSSLTCCIHLYVNKYYMHV